MITSNQVVFHATNQHSADCGPAPNIMNEGSDHYHGYFENPFGEQWVLVYDRKTRRGVLRGGDANWSEEFKVVGRDASVVLGVADMAWLQACLTAAGV